MITASDITAAEAQATWEYAKEHGIDFHAAAALMRERLHEDPNRVPDMVEMVDGRRPWEDAMIHVMAATWAQGLVAGVIAARAERERNGERWPNGDES